MKITIVVYNATYTKALYHVGSFSTADEAVAHRNNSELANKPTKLERLVDEDDFVLPAETLDSSVDYSHAEENGWVETAGSWLYTG
jgi:hypothetical protein